MHYEESIHTVLFKKYATFKGRASRSEYWWSILIVPLISLIGVLHPVLYLVFYLLIVIPTTAVSVRRLHDTNHSGLHLLVPVGLQSLGFLFFAAEWSADFGGILIILGIIYSIYIFYLLIKKSDESDNQYGTNPLLKESRADKF